MRASLLLLFCIYFYYNYYYSVRLLHRWSRRFAPLLFCLCWHFNWQQQKIHTYSLYAISFGIECKIEREQDSRQNHFIEIECQELKKWVNVIAWNVSVCVLACILKFILCFIYVSVYIMRIDERYIHMNLIKTIDICSFQLKFNGNKQWKMGRKFHIFNYEGQWYFEGNNCVRESANHSASKHMGDVI